MSKPPKPGKRGPRRVQSSSKRKLALFEAMGSTFIRATPSNPALLGPGDESLGNLEEGEIQSPTWQREGMQEMRVVSPDASKGRFDFTMEVVRADEDTRMVYMLLKPDARRYDEIERDGEEYFLDKFLRVLIPKKMMLQEMAAQARGLPVHSLSPSIDSTPDYAEARRAALTDELETGQYVAPAEKAVPHQDFMDDRTPRDVAFLSVDICGGSALRRADPKRFDRAYKIFLREMGTIVGQFNGTILKVTGDGFIALIDHPGFTTQCDNTVDMGLSFLVMLRDSINPALEKAGLPTLNIRVGSDYGPTEIREFDIPATGFSGPEVASDALNRAVKIEQSCAENEFRIGRSLYELLHVQWLQRATEVPFNGSDVGIENYKVYRVR